MEDIEILEKYDKQFRQIRDSNFCRLPGSTALKELDEVYRNVFGHSSRLLNGCSGCIYASLKELAKHYFDIVQVRTEPESVNDSESIKKNTTKNKKATNKRQKGEKDNGDINIKKES